MEYEKCYLYKPEGRPTKRRRIEPQGLQSSWNLRKSTYRATWSNIQAKVEEKLAEISRHTLFEVEQFLDSAINADAPQKIPAGIVLVGPSAVSNNSVITQLIKKVSTSERVFASLASNNVSNLKAALRSLIQKATLRPVDVGDDDEELPSTGTRRGPKLLNYDLQLLYDYVQENNIKQVVVTFEDTEAFDGELLSELIELLGCWLNRIPFVCLFSIATSVDSLQQRLSRGAIRCLDGRIFAVASSSDQTEQVFNCIISAQRSLWLGHNLVETILERQRDYIQSIGNLVDGFQYASMSAFYANALTVFLNPDIDGENISTDHFEAIRNLDSFKRHAKTLLSQGKSDDVKDLLDSDDVLYGFVEDGLAVGRMSMQGIMSAIDVIRTLQGSFSGIVPSEKSNLYVQAMAGELSQSPLLRSLLLSIRKVPSDSALKALVAFAKTAPSEIDRALEAITTDLQTLVASSDDKKPLRSEDDVQNSTFRTTVVAQKVELSKQKSTLSKMDAAYTTIIRHFTDLLETFFKKVLINPKDLVLHEIFFYDLKSPYREVFAPRQKHAIERALATPHDYLDCDCCAPGPDHGEGGTLSASQPATSIMYQLYLESGTLINAHDLWLAFQAVVGNDRSEAENMAQYQKGLAEMKYLGLVKSTRRRVDHIAKVAWKGL